MAAIIGYSILTIMIAILDLFIGLEIYNHASDRSRHLLCCCILSALVVLSYQASILTRSKIVTSITSSMYFVAIDWDLYNLCCFVKEYTGRKKCRLGDVVRRILFGLAIFETISFALNPIFGLSIDFIPRDTLLAHFDWQMKPLYYLHLVYTYSMVAIALGMLAEKVVKVPYQYRRQFSAPMEVIILIVLINALFLFLPGDSVLSLLDVSVCGYSAALFSLYWGRYYYAENDMIKGLSMKVFDDIDQALVMFDYNGRLIMQNKKVCSLLCEEALPSRMEMEDFIPRYCPNMMGQQTGDNCILQCSVMIDGRQHMLRCDYSRLRDKHDAVVGYLFAFADAQMETDLRTGFHAWDSFLRRVQAEPKWMVGPTTVAVFDINNLSVINSSFGRDEGDRRLQKLAEHMREVMPAGTYFVRGIDAGLLAMRHAEDEAEMIALAEKVVECCQGSIQFSVSTVPVDGRVLDCIQQAEEGLRVKKLLDTDSSRSQLLNTLVQALQECDSDTEAHVQRTRRMGAALGKKLGLSDVQQGQLSLLCLLHDIGKIGIPLEILNKPGRLSDEEWTVLRSHVEKGYQIAMSSVHLQGIADMILHHHERWDGNGYPAGLSRETIPLLSRIISVVDAYDAMVNDRSYRKAITREKAIEELRRCAGTQFDPRMVSEFIEVLAEEPNIDGVKPRESDLSETEEAVSIVPESREQHNSSQTAVQTIHPVRYSRYILDEDNRIVQVDDAFCDMTGYTSDDIISRNLTQWDLVPSEERLNYQMWVSELNYKDSIVYLEHPLLRKDGSVGYVFCYGRPFYDSALRVSRFEIIISDSTHTNVVQQMARQANKVAMQRLREWEEVYRRDALTGLLNHEAYRNDVEERLLTGEVRVVFLMMDVDRFKQYNDTYGHSAGDDYLVTVSHALTKSLRKEDLACRMGGDEFSAALLFDYMASEELMVRRAKEVFEAVKNSASQIKGSEGISMGAALSNGVDESFRVLYQKADLALYDAKHSGRNRLVIYNHSGQGAEGKSGEKI